MDLDFDDSNSAPSPLSALTESRDSNPHVLIKIGLEHNHGPMDVKQCLRWLESIPLLGKWANIEGVCPSHSTLMIVSMPVSLWDMLPDHPASTFITFIGYVTGPNMISGVPFGDRELASLVGQFTRACYDPGTRQGCSFATNLNSLVHLLIAVVVNLLTLAPRLPPSHESIFQPD
jgi:hypothetical protein